MRSATKQRTVPESAERWPEETIPRHASLLCHGLQTEEEHLGQEPLENSVGLLKALTET